jgi:aspartate racemase
MESCQHIGIVAVSAEGAALCYRTICAEAPVILGSHCHPQITMHTYPLSDYLNHIAVGRWTKAAQLLLSSAGKVAEAGADFLICPDNTLHQALDLVRDESSVPWLHIAEEVAAVAAKHGFERLGILGTRDLMEGPVYPSKLAPTGIEHVIPIAEERRRIDQVIYDELVYGRFEKRARQDYQHVIRGLGERGCDAVVLGCTEIPLLISESDSPLPVLDSTRILARAALREATAEASL